MIVSLPSRTELLSWASQLTQTNVEKLQALSDGIQFCEIFDQIYPKIIHLQKLKRDAKVPLEKQKNFRLLLNAINQLQLSVTINIMDLANGKITAILELLQWMFKEFKKPSFDKNGKNEVKQNKMFEPRMIKSYVGSLVVRQISLHKEAQKSQAARSMTSSRRSLDTRLLQIKAQPQLEKKSIKKSTENIEKKSEKREPSQIKRPIEIKLSSEKKGQSQTNEPSKSKSRIMSIKVIKDDSNEIFQAKRKQLQRIKSEKREINQKKKDNILQALSSTIKLQRQKIFQKLVKVTEAVLENNPQLEQTLKKALHEEGEQICQKSASPNLSPSSQWKSMPSSNKNTSLRCQIDTMEQIQSDAANLISASTLESKMNKNAQNFNEKSESLAKTNHETKDVSMDKKETVKKSSMKLKEQKPQSHFLLSSQVIKQISAQKEKAHNLFNQQKDQNQPENDLSMKRPQALHNPFEKMSNTGMFLTEKKPEFKIECDNFVNKRQVHSENLRTNKETDNSNVWNQNPTVKQQSEQNPSTQAHGIPANQAEVNQMQENKYPDVPAYKTGSFTQHRFY